MSIDLAWVRDLDTTDHDLLIEIVRLLTEINEKLPKLKATSDEELLVYPVHF